MITVTILSVGKNKEPWLVNAIETYVSRLTSTLRIVFVYTKDDNQLTALAEKERSVICLDPSGETFSSEEFCSMLYENIGKGGSRLTFVIGAAEGLPQELKTRHPLMSMSKLTFTHQITRLLLIEQIYRATEIRRGSKYHK